MGKTKFLRQAILSAMLAYIQLHSLPYSFSNTHSASPVFLLREQLKKSVTGSVFFQGKGIGRINIESSTKSLNAIFYGDHKLVFTFQENDWEVSEETADGKFHRLSPSSGIKDGLMKLARMLYFAPEDEALKLAEENLVSSWKLGEEKSIFNAKLRVPAYVSPEAMFELLHNESYHSEQALVTSIELTLDSKKFHVVLD